MVVKASPIVITLEPLVYNQIDEYNVSCYGAADGEITVAAEGGCGNYTYLWSNGATTADISGLTAGVYSLTVTDEHGNSTTKSVELRQPSPLEVETFVTPEYPAGSGTDQHTIYLGYGEQTVTLTASATGGNGDYTYTWLPENEIACSSLNSVVVAPEVTTTYEVIVTDVAGCSVSKTITVNVIDVRCEGGNNGGGQRSGRKISASQSIIFNCCNTSAIK